MVGATSGQVKSHHETRSVLSKDKEKYIGYERLHIEGVVQNTVGGWFEGISIIHENPGLVQTLRL